MISSSKIFLQKKGARETILTVALVVAVLTSLQAFVHSMTARTRRLKEAGGASTALVLDKTPAPERQGDWSPGTLRKTVVPASLPVGGERRNVLVVVTDVSKLVGARGYRLKGEVAEEEREANIGKFLASLADIDVGDDIGVLVGGERVRLHVVGVLNTRGQAAVEILIPEKSAEILPPSEETVSVTEVELTESSLERLRRSTPGGKKVIGTGRVGGFVRGVNAGIVSFLNAWSLIVCAVVAAVSGVGMTRLLSESEHEIEVLRSVGASRNTTVCLVLVSITAIGSAGSLAGVSIGIVGSQAISAWFGWVGGGAVPSPSLGLAQLFRILGLGASSSILGGSAASLVALRRFRG